MSLIGDVTWRHSVASVLMGLITFTPSRKACGPRRKLFSYSLASFFGWLLCELLYRRLHSIIWWVLCFPRAGWKVPHSFQPREVGGTRDVAPNPVTRSWKPAQLGLQEYFPCRKTICVAAYGISVLLEPLREDDDEKAQGDALAVRSPLPTSLLHNNRHQKTVVGSRARVQHHFSRVLSIDQVSGGIDLSGLMGQEIYFCQICDCPESHIGIGLGIDGAVMIGLGLPGFLGENYFPYDHAL